MPRTDKDIQIDLMTELYWDYRVDATDIKAEVSEGEVTLRGSVPSYTTKQLAEQDAQNIDGVSNVNNLLSVSLPTSLSIPSDAELVRRAKNTLSWHPNIDSTRIDISAESGNITLRGSVDTYWKRGKAEKLIADLVGVKNVENHLTVVPTKSFTDTDIGKDIEAALARNVYVKSESITVTVKNGQVILAGTAPSYYARLRAYDTAVNTRGVTDVTNKIVVT